MITNFVPSPSRFESFFNTNYSATASEVEEIKGIIHASEQELAVLDEEIVKLESKLNGLKTRRNAISDLVDNHRKLCSTFRRLSPELLAEISVHCLPSEHLPTRSTLEAPLLLLRVCNKWRQVALDTPRLWCSLHVHIPNCPSDPSLIQRRFTGIDKWLGCLANCPSHSPYTVLDIK
ncbi:hypothetical protein VKT23_013518 [Stygiomarasmius scandens]|uniref:F-box domain-containing protein n=1 Tax=Marasmiellus scandens TaxID=2682957 RepID=A0ABR1J5B9_9AGAR